MHRYPGKSVTLLESQSKSVYREMAELNFNVHQVFSNLSDDYIGLKVDQRFRNCLSSDLVRFDARQDWDFEKLKSLSDYD